MFQGISVFGVLIGKAEDMIYSGMKILLSDRFNIAAKSAILCCICMFVTSCSSRSDKDGQPEKSGKTKTEIQLTSQAFRDGDSIPESYTCDNDNISPGLSWSAPPEGTLSFALICDDPDAPHGTWVHWVIYDIPADFRNLTEAFGDDIEFQNGIKQGKNDFGHYGYDGPCPPPGKPHRYFFKIYSLNGFSGLEPGASKAELENAMQGKITSQGKLVGIYGR